MIGTIKEMRNGQKAMCIEYRSKKDIDIQFEDGYIAENVSWANFARGLIRNPEYEIRNYIGKVNLMSNGQQAICIEYKSMTDIDVRFEDGYVSRNNTWYNFQKGLIRNPTYSKYLGKSRIMKNGMEAKVKAYRNSQDIDIEFQDGTIVRKKSIGNWLGGNVGYPRRQTLIQY